MQAAQPHSTVQGEVHGPPYGGSRPADLACSVAQDHAAAVPSHMDSPAISHGADPGGCHPHHGAPTRLSNAAPHQAGFIKLVPVDGLQQHQPAVVSMITEPVEPAAVSDPAPVSVPGLRRTIYSTLESLGDDVCVASPDIGIVKHRSKKQATILLSPAHLIHVPRTFLQEHFDLNWVLANGLHVQIDADGTLDPEIVHATVANYQNKSGYSYHRLLGFKGVCRKYMNWRVIGWQAVDHRTVRLCISKPSPAYTLPVKPSDKKHKDKRSAHEIDDDLDYPPSKGARLMYSVSGPHTAATPQQAPAANLTTPVADVCNYLPTSMLNGLPVMPAQLTDAAVPGDGHQLTAQSAGQVQVLALDGQLLQAPAGIALANAQQLMLANMQAAAGAGADTHTQSAAAQQQQHLLLNTGGASAATTTWVSPDGMQVWAVPLNGSGLCMAMPQQPVTDTTTATANPKTVTINGEQYQIVDGPTTAMGMMSHQGVASQSMDQHLVAADGAAIVNLPVQYMMMGNAGGSGGGGQQQQQQGGEVAQGNAPAAQTAAPSTTGADASAEVPAKVASSRTQEGAAEVEEGAAATTSVSTAPQQQDQQQQKRTSAFTALEPHNAAVNNSMSMPAPGTGYLTLDASGQTVCVINGPQGLTTVPIMQPAPSPAPQTVTLPQSLLEPLHVFNNTQAPAAQPVMQHVSMQLPGGQVVLMQVPTQPQPQQLQFQPQQMVLDMNQAQQLMLNSAHHMLQQQQPAFVTYAPHPTGGHVIQQGAAHLMPSGGGAGGGAQHIHFMSHLPTLTHHMVAGANEGRVAGGDVAAQPFIFMTK